MDAGRFNLEPRDVDLAGVVRAAEETVRVTAATASVEVVVDVPEEGLVVPGDAVRLGQACDNLVSNAVKFTPSGGRVTLSLRTAWAAPDGAVSADERPGSAPVRCGRNSRDAYTSAAARFACAHRCRRSCTRMGAW